MVDSVGARDSNAMKPRPIKLLYVTSKYMRSSAWSPRLTLDRIENNENVRSSIFRFALSSVGTREELKKEKAYIYNCSSDTFGCRAHFQPPYLATIAARNFNNIVVSDLSHTMQRLPPTIAKHRSICN